jgi:hypothetical protein
MRHSTALMPAPPAAATAPGQRIGDDDRERASTELRRHFTEGRLDTDEFSARLEEVWSAKTGADLDHALRDLPRPPVGSPPAAARHPHPPGFLPVVAIVVGVALLAGARWGVVWLIVLAMFIFARRYRGFRSRGAAPRSAGGR